MPPLNIYHDFECVCFLADRKDKNRMEKGDVYLEANTFYKH